MKISKIVNCSFRVFAAAALVGSMASCGSTKVPEAPAVEEPAPVVEEEPAPVEEPPVVQEELPVAEEPAPVVEEESNDDDEYSRSVGDVTVSRDTFVEDKEKVLRIIQRLDGVMKDMNYKEWLTYVDDESVKYWQQSSNLKKAQKRLPVKGLKLNSLQDYFKYVFVPARKGRTVTEIRYISDTYIKAIQVQEEGDDIVYYYFNKLGGYWMVHLPPLDN